MHIYYGDTGLILTELTKENFDSGLSRVDCIYRCRTTSASTLEPTLQAGQPVPDDLAFVIRDSAKRKDAQDGFTTFAVSGFFAALLTAPNLTTPIPSTLGAQSLSCDLAVSSAAPSSDFPGITPLYNFKLQILADTLTRKFTMLAADSVTQLNLPEVTLKIRIVNAILQGPLTNFSVAEIEALFMLGSTGRFNGTDHPTHSTYTPGTLALSLSSQMAIINVNRTSFGFYDEVTVTWGLEMRDSSLVIIYER